MRSALGTLRRSPCLQQHPPDQPRHSVSQTQQRGVHSVCGVCVWCMCVSSCFLPQHHCNTGVKVQSEVYKGCRSGTSPYDCTGSEKTHSSEERAGGKSRQKVLHQLNSASCSLKTAPLFQVTKRVIAKRGRHVHSEDRPHSQEDGAYAHRSSQAPPYRQSALHPPSTGSSALLINNNQHFKLSVAPKS